jgi:hypothetical protein
MNRLVFAVAILGAATFTCHAQSRKSPSLAFESVRFTAGDGPMSVAISDLNNDRKPDVIVANGRSNNVTILLGDGKGRLSQAKGSPFPAGDSPNDVAVGDFNGDGKPDLAFPNHGTAYITVLLGDGTGEFAAGLQTHVQSRPHPHGIAVGDFNDDRKIDAAIESWGNNQVEVLLGKGNGQFQTPGAFFNVGKMPYQRLRCGDVNADGKPDIITTNFEGNSVSILLCDGKGGFTQSKGSPVAVPKSPFGVAVGDVNGDGNLDLAIAHYSGHAGDPSADGLSVLLGDGAGTFTLAAGCPFPAGKAPVGVAVGDINGDGILDIAVSNYLSDNVSVYLGGSKGFIEAHGSPFAAGRNVEGIALGDLNGDGKADIVTANNRDNDVTVLLSK